MASRRFFAYDPYDYYYSTPYHYPYHHHPAPARSHNAFFPAGGYDAEPAVRAAEHQPRPRSRSVSVPVRFVGSDPEPDIDRQELRAPLVARTMAAAAAAAAAAKKRAPSAEEAAVRVQAAARGFLARRMVREVRTVEREAEGVAARLATEAEALRGDARARVAVGEALMRLLLRLDAVHGAREYRRRVTKRVLALQDAVDALEPRAAAAPAAVEMVEAHAAEEGQMEPESPEDAEHGVDMEAKAVVEAPATEAPAAVEMAEAHAAEEGQMEPESPEDAEHGVDMEARAVVEATATETAAEMEVDGVRATSQRDATDDGEKPEEAEGEWEMVTEESAAACNAKAGEGSAAPEDAERRQEPAGEEEEEKKAKEGAPDGLEARWVMEMVAALCERSAQQCAVIGALAERVDALERAVRRVEEGDRRRRRNKKLKDEGKRTARSSF